MGQPKTLQFSALEQTNCDILRMVDRPARPIRRFSGEDSQDSLSLTWKRFSFQKTTDLPRFPLCAAISLHP